MPTGTSWKTASARFVLLVLAMKEQKVTAELILILWEQQLMKSRPQKNQHHASNVVDHIFEIGA